MFRSVRVITSVGLGNLGAIVATAGGLAGGWLQTCAQEVKPKPVRKQGVTKAQVEAQTEAPWWVRTGLVRRP